MCTLRQVGSRSPSREGATRRDNNNLTGPCLDIFSTEFVSPVSPSQGFMYTVSGLV